MSANPRVTQTGKAFGQAATHNKGAKTGRGQKGFDFRRNSDSDCPVEVFELVGGAVTGVRCGTGHQTAGRESRLTQQGEACSLPMSLCTQSRQYREGRPGM